MFPASAYLQARALSVTPAAHRAAVPAGAVLRGGAPPPERGRGPRACACRNCGTGTCRPAPRSDCNAWCGAADDSGPSQSCRVMRCHEAEWCLRAQVQASCSRVSMRKGRNTCKLRLRSKRPRTLEPPLKTLGNTLGTKSPWALRGALGRPGDQS